MLALLLSLSIVTTPCLSQPLRVRLTVDAESARAFTLPVRAIVEEVWRPAGLTIAWVDEGAAWEGTDFWLALLHGMKPAGGEVIGRVQFDRGIPQPLARISIDDAVLWTRRYRASLLATTMMALNSGGADDVRLVERLMGYAAAHEVGHFVLASKAHAANGIMQSTFRNGASLALADLWRLDGANLLRFHARQSDSCAAKRADAR
jgi:hypothetical protein